MQQKRLLNWSIGVFVVMSVFARTWLERQMPEVHWAFVFAPIVLGFWVVKHAMHRLRIVPQHDVPAHRRLEDGDYFRAFCTLWAGYLPLASTHLMGFWLFTCIVALLLCGLITVSFVDLFMKKQATPLAIGCGAFIYFLLAWERNVFVEHYGVPIIGHFFEQPEYDARYYVEAERDGSHAKYRLVADIHVKGRSETDEVDEDRFGMPIFRTYSYRDVRVLRLHFSNGGSVTIQEQTEALQLGESVFVTDASGVAWYVTLLNDYVR